MPDPAPPAPLAPPPPDWPANDRPSDATVTWDAHGLGIVAGNSSLSQILKQVCTETGATMEGLNRDQRIFGVYGPGPARDVIAQLLDGSGYNVLMIGDLGQGTPRQIVLTGRAGGASKPGVNDQPNTDSDNDAEPEEQAQEPDPAATGAAFANASRALRLGCPYEAVNKWSRTCSSGCVSSNNSNNSRRTRNKLAFRKLPYEMRAVSGCCFKAAGFGCGRISAKPTRKMNSAVSSPNAIAPRDAQINITKSSKFAIRVT